MKIEITNRTWWIDHCEKILKEITIVRNEENLYYERQWRKRWLLPDRKETEFPPHYSDCYDYPSKSYSTLEWYTKRLIEILSDDKTGNVFLEDHEYNKLRYPKIFDKEEN